MNPHMNLFRFFSENESNTYIENNLSRALSICLKNDPLFFIEFLRMSILPEDFDNLFSYFDPNNLIEIDLQINTKNIDIGNPIRVYPITITTSPSIDMSDFFDVQWESQEKTVTDIYFTVGNLAFIIEVKANETDCKAQLFGQVSHLIKAVGSSNFIPKSISWQMILECLERVETIYKTFGTNAPIISDFLKHVSINFPDWFSPKPLSSYLSKDMSLIWPNNIINLWKRLRQIVAETGISQIESYDRLGFSFENPCASECLIDFESDTDGVFLILSVYPGNTKAQGRILFEKNQKIEKQKSIHYNGNEYHLKTMRHIKFSHFQKYFTSIDYFQTECSKEAYTLQNYNTVSGRKRREEWKDIENKFDEYFDFDWRDRSNWNEVVMNSKRSYFDLSLGYPITLRIPFDDFAKKDVNQTVSPELLGMLSDLYKALLSVLPC